MFRSPFLFPLPPFPSFRLFVFELDFLFCPQFFFFARYFHDHICSRFHFMIYSPLQLELSSCGDGSGPSLLSDNCVRYFELCSMHIISAHLLSLTI